MCNNNILSLKSINNCKTYHDLNIDQNDRDYHIGHNRAVLILTIPAESIHASTVVAANLLSRILWESSRKSTVWSGDSIRTPSETRQSNSWNIKFPYGAQKKG